MQIFDIPYTKVLTKVFQKADQIAREYGMGVVGTEHMLLAFFEVPCLPEKILKEKGLTREKAEEAIRTLLGSQFTRGEADKSSRVRLPFTPLLELIIGDSRDLAADLNAPAIGTEHFFTALLQDIDGIASKIILMMGADPLELEEHMLDAMGDDRFALEDLLTAPQQSTDTLNKYTRDLTYLAYQKKLDPVVGREKELERLIQILCRRTKNNPCLIGEPGVGKTAIVEALAQRLVQDQVPDLLKRKRLLALDLAALVAGTKYRGEFEERMKALIDELYAHPEILLFIDEFHTLIGAGGAEGSLDAANILKPALSRGEVQIIGATTTNEYKKKIEKDTALKRRFQSILVEEPSFAETLAVLSARLPLYEKHHRVRIGMDAAEACVRLSGRYISERLWPDKALDLLDEACSAIRLKHAAGAVPTLSADDVARSASLWTGVPLSQLTKEEGSRLMELENELHKRVIGQQEAISALSRSIRRSRVGLHSSTRPIGSFLFLGPTGVGKTELTKALSAALFGDEKSLVRLDMSEYMEKHSVSKIIGSPPGYVGFEEGGQLSDRIRRHPYSVVLFDEIEKAHPDVFNILLQILDDGRLTDAQGTTVDFRNTVIVMTSNAGAERIVEPKTLGFSDSKDDGADYRRMKDNVLEEVKRSFRPEFLNRIDEIVVFHALGKEEIAQILDLQLKELEKRLADSHPITLLLSKEARNYFIEKGYQPKYGARPLRRLLQTELEDPLAEAILAGRITDGDTALVTYEQENISLQRRMTEE